MSSGTTAHQDQSVDPRSGRLACPSEVGHVRQDDAAVAMHALHDWPRIAAAGDDDDDGDAMLDHDVGVEAQPAIGTVTNQVDAERRRLVLRRRGKRRLDFRQPLANALSWSKNTFKIASF